MANGKVNKGLIAARAARANKGHKPGAKAPPVPKHPTSPRGSVSSNPVKSA